MIQVNIFEIKAKLSEYLDRVVRGEHIVICRHNKPVAELRPLVGVRAKPRPIGPVAGRPRFEIAPSFFEPLEAVEIDAWEGVTPTASDSAPDGAAKVAERRSRYVKQPRSRAPRRRA